MVITKTGFSRSFSSFVVQAEGVDAVFSCHQPTNSGIIEWQINGTSIRDVNSSLIRKGGRGNGTEALIITALSEFNETSIDCFKYSLTENGNVTYQSEKTELIVQGI